MMQHNDGFLYDDNGNPFHGREARIYREPDGTLTYECQHCGRHEVPRRFEKAMARYAIERPKH